MKNIRWTNSSTDNIANTFQRIVCRLSGIENEPVFVVKILDSFGILETGVNENLPGRFSESFIDFGHPRPV